MKKIDERDTVFARMAWKKDSDAYNDYYAQNRDTQTIDDKIRELPELGGEGGSSFHPVNSKLSTSLFRFISDIRPLVEGTTSQKRTLVDPQTITHRLKSIASHFGVDLVGIAKMEDSHYYSHRGRNEENYGTPITKQHKYGIVFAVEMERDFINRAPQLEETIETTKGYLSTAVLGMVLSYFIRELGYDARNHMDGNYLVIAPLVAESAGLGELGRIGLLVTRKYGPRVRLGVVTTNLELIPDEPAPFGIKEFCTECSLCSQNCPSKALPFGNPKPVSGILKWQIAQEKCYRLWRKLGTDCGVCLSSCPFSQEIPPEQIAKIKTDPKIRKTIINTHKKRPYIKTPLPIIK